ncbi:MAG: hypothetical protein ACI4EL_02755 [Candidatus Fimimorpha sp.]
MQTLQEAGYNPIIAHPERYYFFSFVCKDAFERKSKTDYSRKRSVYFASKTILIYKKEKMKIIRRLVLVMTILTAALFAVFWQFWFTKNDVEGPVITCDEEKYSVSIEATEEELLKGMHAWEEASSCYKFLAK